MRPSACLMLAAGLLAGGLCVALAPAASARELLMFERKGCAYCLKFDHDVAPIYEKTDEGQRAPLRRVDLSDGTPRDVVLAAPVRFTPTFVLVDEGREVGRITGYASDEAFWGLLGSMQDTMTDRMAGARP
ncbi:MAG: thioredoxin fold domain-containing protein [Rhizobiales bacterium]|uniref:thioredoxin fold domain-containing protein n=1 Tax=Xanthobacter sp. SG618 TaxID=2587121 RepID=UPI00145E4AB6|nr:thioredoxin fold domain-containing protein [Xanthobacter sp. SG618]MBN8914128.1 thioredoxin fold domain-containing protein [Hyphomicrobiales bacterium]NMN59606.1 thioredoxin-related protein [Xanthobacter sp. SG618]